jgi:hypothetical protein
MLSRFGMTQLDARLTVDDKFYTFCPHNLWN